MFRTLAAVAVGLIFLPWQAPLAADDLVAEVDEQRGVAPITIPSPYYRRLQVQLQQHRVLAEAGGWPEVPAGPTIRPGSNDPRLAILASRLVASGDLADNGAAVSPSAYDVVMQDAVRRFQARHGLEVDTLVGRATLRALNVSVEQRINQIRVNLERTLSLFDGQGDDFVLVNIAGFSVTVVRDGQTVWTTSVIVGDTENKTPIFGSTLKYVVFNPTWTVPHSIASKEMLPEIKQDPGFFDRGDYQLLDREGNIVEPSSVDWSVVHVGNFRYTLVQQPGCSNALGQIKFVFPNEFSVFMHDTPEKWLFADARRAFSHGCIRVNDPFDLAKVLLGRDGWTKERIESQIESEETKTVFLSEPLPILLVYWTAEVDDLGVVHFYDDIYERDAAALEALDRPLR
jgi:murein L,D-transpeptidase YcbB/YkuD